MPVSGGTHDRAAESGRRGASTAGITRTPDPTSGPDGRLARWGRPAAVLVLGGAVLWGTLSIIGQIITHTSLGSAVVRGDTRVSRWFFAGRTPQFDRLTHYGTMLSDTLTAIIVTVVVVTVLFVLRRRWEAATVLVAILGELFVFVLVTATVQRARPPVPHLDPAPPTSSFPSGHTAAAVALYVGFAVLLLRSAVRRALAVPLAVLFCLVPFVVGISRLYRGMHYPSDVVFGALGGGCWLLLTLYVLSGPPTRALRAASSRRSDAHQDTAPARTH